MRKTSGVKPSALVTGGAKRIGQAICLKLASLGYNVAVHYHHSQKEAQRTAASVRKTGVLCEIFKCDLADERQTKAMIPRVLRIFPQLTVLINNASIFKKSGLNPNDIKLFNSHFFTNLKAPYILTSVFAQQCPRGHIINIVDAGLFKNKTAYLAYRLTKRALWDLTQLSAVDLAPAIRVNAVAPGLILPPVGAGPEYLRRRARHIPLQYMGDVRHVTEAIRFLLENDYLTGQIIFADGGEHLA